MCVGETERERGSVCVCESVCVCVCVSVCVCVCCMLSFCAGGAVDRLW